MRTPLRPSVLGAALLLTAGCFGFGGDAGKFFSDLLSLQQGIVQQFGDSDIGINRNTSGLLTVTFTNSHFAALPDSAQAAEARKVAEYVRDHYPEYGGLTQVSIALRSQQGGGGFSVSTSNVPYSWTTAELGPSPLHPDSVTSGDRLKGPAK